MDNLYEMTAQVIGSEESLWEVDSKHVLNAEESLPAYWNTVHTYTRPARSVQPDLDMFTLASFLTEEDASDECFNTGVRLPESSGYVYACSDAGEVFRTLSVLGALALAGEARGRWPFPNTEIENLCQGLLGHKLMPYVYLASGQKVRIKAGPFAGSVGYLVRQEYCMRVVISAESIEQSVAVEVDIDEVEALGPAPSAFAA